jgi:hypothetical protein
VKEHGRRTVHIARSAPEGGLARISEGEKRRRGRDTPAMPRPGGPHRSAVAAGCAAEPARPRHARAPAVPALVGGCRGAGVGLAGSGLWKSGRFRAEVGQAATEPAARCAPAIFAGGTSSRDDQEAVAFHRVFRGIHRPMGFSMGSDRMIHAPAVSVRKHTTACLRQSLAPPPPRSMLGRIRPPSRPPSILFPHGQSADDPPDASPLPRSSTFFNGK